MEPRASANERAARKPFRTVVTVGRTSIRSVVIIAVRAVRGGSDADADVDLGLYFGSGHCEADCSNSRYCKILESVHKLSSVVHSYLLDASSLWPQRTPESVHKSALGPCGSIGAPVQGGRTCHPRRFLATVRIGTAPA